MFVIRVPPQSQNGRDGAFSPKRSGIRPPYRRGSEKRMPGSGIRKNR